MNLFVKFVKEKESFYSPFRNCKGKLSEKYENHSLLSALMALENNEKSLVDTRWQWPGRVVGMAA